MIQRPGIGAAQTVNVVVVQVTDTGRVLGRSEHRVFVPVPPLRLHAHDFDFDLSVQVGADLRTSTVTLPRTPEVERESEDVVTTIAMNWPVASAVAARVIDMGNDTAPLRTLSVKEPVRPAAVALRVNGFEPL